MGKYHEGGPGWTDSGEQPRIIGYKAAAGKGSTGDPRMTESGMEPIFAQKLDTVDFTIPEHQGAIGCFTMLLCVLGLVVLYV
jgi:hypothetical protein